MEKWNELCFLLKENLPTNVSEELFESKVLLALEKLGWSEFNGEIVVRESIQSGSANRIAPDITIRSQSKENLFVIEVKRPSLELSSPKFIGQLSSYMGIQRVKVGILIGSKIHIFIDSNSQNGCGISLIEEIEFCRDNEKGFEFIEVFGKNKFSQSELNDYISRKNEALLENQNFEALKAELNDIDLTEMFKEFLKLHFSDKYKNEIIDKVFEQYAVSLSNTEPNSTVSQTFRPNETRNITKSYPEVSSNGNAKLPIGKFVRQTIHELIHENLITKEELVNLQNPDYSKRTFDIQFPFFAKESSKHYIYERYWKDRFRIGNEEFYACSQWYEVPANNDRPFFETWLRKIRRKN